MAFITVTGDPLAFSFLDRAYAFDSGLARFQDRGTIFTTGGHRIDFKGRDLVYDADGRPIGGTIDSFTIDHGGNNPSDAEIAVTGISIDAALIGGRPSALWEAVSDGTTIVNVQGAASLPNLIIYGDDEVAEGRLFEDDGRVTDRGSADILTIGGGLAQVTGDVLRISGVVEDSDGFSRYEGGRDQILASEASERQILSGDASEVDDGGTLIGGDDLLSFAFNASGSLAAGDALAATGFQRRAIVIGGDDTITSKGVTGQVAGDVIFALGAVRIDGGDDTISVRAGEATLTLAAGDVYEFNGGNEVTAFRAGRVNGGDDVITIGTGRGTVVAGDVLHVIVAEPDRIVSGSPVVVGGNDTIFGGGEDDSLFGDVGDISGSVTTRLSIVGGDDEIHGGGGNDVIFGDVQERDGANDVIAGGRDRLFGDGGHDLLAGGGGNDMLEGGAGADTLDGGAGRDSASYAGAASAVTAKLNNSAANAGEALGDVYEGIENLIGSDFDDRLAGDSGRNLLFGRDGDDHMAGGSGADLLHGGRGNDKLAGGHDKDSLEGGDGNDLLEGGAGADTLDGGAGADTLDGGAGRDFASYAGAASAVTAKLHNSAANAGEALGDVYKRIENLIGSDFDDRLVGNSGQNLLRGGKGSDQLAGGRGADSLDGGAGNDSLEGGAGADQFVIRPAEGVDRIRDFQDGLDLIDLSAFDLVDTGSDQDWRGAATFLAQVGDNVRIDWNDGGRLILEEFVLTALTDADFLF